MGRVPMRQQVGERERKMPACGWVIRFRRERGHKEWWRLERELPCLDSITRCNGNVPEGPEGGGEGRLGISLFRQAPMVTQRLKAPRLLP